MKARCVGTWSGRLLLLLLAPVVVIGLLEAGLRLAGNGVDPSFVIRDEVDGRLVYRENPDIGRLWFPRGLARSPVPFAVPEKTNDLRLVVLGESAAMGDPAPAFGLAPFLEAILRTRYPDHSIDVVNAAMTAIDSSVIAAIAPDLAPLEPDYVIVYMGNNEVVGPFGPEPGARPSFRQDAAYARLALGVRATRTGQLLRSWWERWRGEGTRQWEGLALFEDRVVAADNPVLPRLHRRYAANLDAILDAVEGMGATPVVGTMATRVNWPPFGAGADDAAAAGEALEAEGRWSEALEVYRQGAAAEPAMAGWSYRVGRALIALGDVTGGIEAYTRARDLDSLRFRADSEMNRLAREAGEARGLAVDLDAGFHQFWGRPERYFWDHVHLTPQGNYVAAAAIIHALEGDLAARGFEPKGPVPSFDDVRRRLPYTEWDRLQLATVMHQRMLREPLSRIPYHREFTSRLTREITELRKLADRDMAEAVRDVLVDAVNRDPAGFYPISRLGRLYEDMGRFPEAFEVAEMMMRRWPWVGSARSFHGRCLVRAGRLDDGIAALEEGENEGPAKAWVIARIEAASILAETSGDAGALALLDDVIEAHPDYAKAWYNRGIIHARAGNEEQAERDYRRALELDPDMAEAANNLGVAALKREDLEQAESWFRDALERQPLLISALRNMAVVTMMRGEWETAYLYSQQLQAYDPELPEVSGKQTAPAAGPPIP